MNIDDDIDYDNLTSEQQKDIIIRLIKENKEKDDIIKEKDDIIN